MEFVREDDPALTVLNPAIPEEDRPRCPECSKSAAWFCTLVRYVCGWEALTVPDCLVTVLLPCGHTVQLAEGRMLLCVQRPVELADTDDGSRDRWWFGLPSGPMTI